ncbi:unnamed protein product [Sphacelaria rigidula]
MLIAHTMSTHRFKLTQTSCLPLPDIVSFFLFFSSSAVVFDIYVYIYISLLPPLRTHQCCPPTPSTAYNRSFLSAQRRTTNEPWQEHLHPRLLELFVFSLLMYMAGAELLAVFMLLIPLLSSAAMRSPPVIDLSAVDFGATRVDVVPWCDFSFASFFWLARRGIFMFVCSVRWPAAALCAPASSSALALFRQRILLTLLEVWEDRATAWMLPSSYGVYLLFFFQPLWPSAFIALASLLVAHDLT